MQHAISVEHITKTYSSGASAVHALHEVSMNVVPGELVLMMGPSGSGKTTLLSIMGCILTPTSGRIWIKGQNVSALSDSLLPKVRRSHIGFIFQGFNLFPALNVGENVEVALDLKGIRGGKARRISQELLDRVGLADKLYSYPADLSGGQKQRVAIARALAGDPDIILADEPTAALDSTSGQIVMEMLRELAHERGRAVVIVTHDNRILHYADRMVRIEDGKLKELPTQKLATVAVHANQGSGFGVQGL